jgi:signal peptidase I
MGDNRNHSKDSRDPEIGFIDSREILGKAIFVLFPGTEEDTKVRHFDRIGALS